MSIGEKMQFTSKIFKDILLSTGHPEWAGGISDEGVFSRYRVADIKCPYLEGDLMFIPQNDSACGDILSQLESYDAWYTRMLEACTERDAIKKMIRIGTEKFLNPIAHFDRNRNLICYDGEFQKPIQGTIWEKVLDYGFAPSKFYTLSEWWNVSSAITKKDDPSMMVLEADPVHYNLSLGIFVNNTLAGTLGAIDLNCSISDGQIDVLKIISGVLARAYGDRGHSRPIDDLSSSFFERLISGENIPESQINAQLKRYGWSLDDCFRIIYIYSSMRSDLEIDYGLQILQNHFPGSFCCKFESAGALIFRAKQLTELSDDEKTEIREEFERTRIFGIIGNRFRGFKYLRSVYLNCDEARAFITETETPYDNLSRYEDIYALMVSNKMRTDNKMRKFVQPILLELYEMGRESDIELIRDLYIYLNNGENVAKAAKKRYIHRSTFTYRLNKLSDMLFMDLMDLSREESLYLYLSCVILLGRSPA